MWGRKDQVLPFGNSQKVIQAIPSVEFQAMDDAGHNSNYENPEVVNPLLIKFLKSGRYQQVDISRGA
jgi:pimeloyl-ACP methyl ester carboxylesterase